MANKEQSLDNLRHSCAHLLAAAVIKLWPNTKRAIGPAIEDGFYFDFEFPPGFRSGEALASSPTSRSGRPSSSPRFRESEAGMGGENPISEKDFPKIEKAMREIVKSWDGFERHELSKEAAKKEYPNNPYKHELIDEFAGIGEKLSFYKSGDYWDLCRGGHIDNPKKELQNFKLLSVAGAYWRGSEKNPMLTRIYGTCFPTKEELDKHLLMLEEAKKRDHKKLGKELDLFTFSELVGPGLPLWTPKGTILRNVLDDYVWQLRKECGYNKVEIPHITKKDLFEKSGHWDKFKDELFKITTREGHLFALKPMNCPHHIEIFNRKQFSYREMPQRYANTTMQYRDEQTGELSGLSRVRSISIDDCHTFCRTSQFKKEALKAWDIINEFYKSVGFPHLKVRLSLHDPEHPEKYLGSKDIWQEAEQSLRDLAKTKKVEALEAIGEAAFYGPKVDFLAQDSLGREWQLSTIQLDMQLPERFNLNCINEKGEKERIVMLHLAVMGSIERLLSILIEHFAGAFPVWFSPVQAKILPISDKQNKYAQEVTDELKANNIRVELDDRSESIGKKIREAEMQKIPYMLIVGEKEVAAKSVSVRARGEKDLGLMSLQKFLEKVKKEIETKAL